MTQGNWIAKSNGKQVEDRRPKIRVSIPRFDNSELIASFSKTLIGRCMNPAKQDMKTLLFLLPRIWNVEGRVAGIDLGLGRFQFNFDLEEDIVEVLKMEPFHFDFWMVSLVRWKPVLEPNYPSKITFWVHVLDLPLQFQVAQIFQGVGEALGQVQGPVDLVEGKVRVEIDGFQPLAFSASIEIEEGVEITAPLRYEKLVGYCKECFHLTHDKSQCPKLVKEVPEAAKEGGSQLESHDNTSYKAMVVNGTRVQEGQRGEQQNRHHSFRGGAKGKEIARDIQGAAGMDGSFHPYREKCSRRYGRGGGINGRQGHSGDRRRESRHRGQQHPHTSGGDLGIEHQAMSMMGDNNGALAVSKEGEGSGTVGLGVGSVSKARKALFVEESFEQDLDVALPAKTMEESAMIDEVKQKEEEQSSSQALDDANLMIEGVLLSDSELMVEDGDELETWEQGELEDFLEDGEMKPEDKGAVRSEEIAQPQDATDGESIQGTELSDGGVAQSGEEVLKNIKENGDKKAVGGPSKKRGAPTFVSPRKKLLANAMAKLAEKGNKRAPTKPKKPLD